MTDIGSRLIRARTAAMVGALGAAAATGFASPAHAAYRPACLKMLNVALKPTGVVGQVKWACPPTGASTWRYSLQLTSMPDCDFATLPTSQMGGPFAFGDPWPINRVLETRPAGKSFRVNNWVVCVSVYEGASQKPVGRECTNNVFIETGQLK